MKDSRNKLTEERALRIKRLVARGRWLKTQASYLNDKSLGEKFDIHPATIRALCSGRNARNISDDDKRLLSECFTERARLLDEARLHSQDAVARQEGVSVSLVYHICAGTMWCGLPDIEDLILEQKRTLKS